MIETWHDAHPDGPPACSLDRDADEGPKPRCCARRYIAADQLVRYDVLPAAALARITGRFPNLAVAQILYLCDACSETLVREKVLSREERAIGFELSAAAVAKARAHDALFER